MNIVRTNNNDPGFQSLVKELDADLRNRYQELQDTYAQYNKVPDLPTVIVAYENGVSVGCGCFKPFDDDSVEIKRMFVVPAYRGSGIAVAILNELEKWAGELNFKYAVLETGTKNYEALRFYQREGYLITANYGQYVGMETSVCMKKTLMNDLPNLNTGRLMLRALKDTDANEIFRLRSDERINRYIDRPGATSTEDAIMFIRKIQSLVANREGFYWAITVKGSDTLIGTVAVWNLDHQHKKAELGYELWHDHQGKGFMQEAVQAVVQFVFNTLRLSSIEAWTHSENTASSALLEKLGFTSSNSAENVSVSGEIIYTLRNPDHS